MKVKVNNYKLIYLEWHDAFGRGGWRTSQELDEWKKGEFVVREVGWLIEETDKQIILAGRHVPPDNGDDELYGGLQKIPTTWIRKRIDLTKHIK